MRRPDLVRHIALVDYSEQSDGDVVTALCGRVAPGFKYPRGSLFLCRTCYRALEDEYEAAALDHNRLAKVIGAAASLMKAASS